MKNVFLIYDACCFYEITILSYFLSYSHRDIVFCSCDGGLVETKEGFKVQSDMALKDVALSQIQSIIIPGGAISAIDHEVVWTLLKNAKKHHVLIAGICAGVDVLDHAGILEDVNSTHSVDLDLVKDHHVITARANAYVDFAIETAKELDLFTSEEDVKDTIRFWKYHGRYE